MKKLTSTVLILVGLLSCIIGLVACDPGTKYFDVSELLDNTVKIELVNYENNDPEFIRVNGKKKPIFDFNKVTLIATLDESCFEDILNDVANTKFLDFGTALNEPMGKTLVLYQNDGNIIVLYGCVYTDKKGETKYPGDCYIFNEKGELVEYLGRVGYLFSDHIESTYFDTSP